MEIVDKTTMSAQRQKQSHHGGWINGSCYICCCVLLSDETQQRSIDVIGKRQAKATTDTKGKACGNSFAQKKA